jgi:hypothetical protein
VYFLHVLGHQFALLGRIQWLLILQTLIMMQRENWYQDVFISWSLWMALHTRGILISKPMATIWNSLQYLKRCSTTLQLVIFLFKGSCDVLLKIVFPDYISLKVPYYLSCKKNLYELLLLTRLTYHFFFCSLLI